MYKSSGCTLVSARQIQRCELKKYNLFYRALRNLELCVQGFRVFVIETDMTKPEQKAKYSLRIENKRTHLCKNYLDKGFIMKIVRMKSGL